MAKEINTAVLAALTEIDEQKAIDLAESVHAVSGLGCTLYVPGEEMMAEIVFSVGSCMNCCPLCSKNPNKEMWNQACQRIHTDAADMAHAFGGQYTYLCPEDRIFVVSSIYSSAGPVAAITVGPVHIYAEDETEKGYPGLEPFPIRDSTFINKLTLLFSSALFSLANQDEPQQEQASGYVNRVMTHSRITSMEGYPIEWEQTMFDAVKRGDRAEARFALNEVMGEIFKSKIKGDYILQRQAREITVVVSRAAMMSGVRSEIMAYLSDQCTRELRFMTEPELMRARLLRFVDEATRYVGRLLETGLDDAMLRAGDYIYDHFHGKISLESIAHISGYSPPYFSRLFKEKMGCTFSEYLNRVRVQACKGDLVSTDDSMEVIAERNGFTSANYMTRIFKRITGVTPSYYRVHHGATAK